MNDYLLPEHLLASPSQLRAVSPRIKSSLPTEDAGADYDRIAGLYDLVIGNSLYNRIMWGSWPSRYAQAAHQALSGAGEDWILDCGCGSLCFTASSYRQAPFDRMILFDRSLGMLTRGHRRMPEGQFLQGDSLEMPFVDSVFGTSMAWGLLHIFGSRSQLLPELRRVTKPGGRVFLSSLVLRA